MQYSLGAQCKKCTCITSHIASTSIASIPHQLYPRRGALIAFNRSLPTTHPRRGVLISTSPTFFLHFPLRICIHTRLLVLRGLQSVVLSTIDGRLLSRGGRFLVVRLLTRSDGENDEYRDLPMDDIDEDTIVPDSEAIFSQLRIDQRLSERKRMLLRCIPSHFIRDSALYRLGKCLDIPQCHWHE